MTDGGKGSKPSPFSVSNEEYASRWDAIFQRDREEDLRSNEETQESKENEDSNH